MKTVDKIPAQVQELIDQYMGLDIAGKKVQTPYYINLKKAKGQLRALVGKGTPEEIVEEVLIYARLRGFDLASATPDEIREFMIKQDIGIDCSGFVAQVLNYWLKLKGHSSLRSKISFNNASLWHKFKTALRPIENIGANRMTNNDNTTPISLNEIMPGDLIRLKGLRGGHHITVIVETTRQDNALTAFKYAHSSTHYDNKNGVKYGEVEITDINKELKDQNWKELDQKGECPTLKQLLKEYEDNGLRRLNFFEDLK